MKKEVITNNLYLIIGEDSLLVNFYLTDILNKLDCKEDEKICYDMDVDSFEMGLGGASMINMFSSRKIIVVSSFNVGNLKEGEVDYLKRYLDNENKSVYLILLAKKVDARVKEYKIFKEKFLIIDTGKVAISDDLVNYVREYVKKVNYKMDDGNIEYFLSKKGNDVGNINMELEKLFNYSDNMIITREDIDKLVMDSVDNIIYEFTNAFFDNDVDAITGMYEGFKVNNMGDDYLISALSNSLHQALIIKILYNEGSSNYKIASFIGKKEFYVKKMLERLSRYTIRDIEEMINKLGDIDREYKTGKNNSLALSLFLLGKR